MFLALFSKLGLPFGRAVSYQPVQGLQAVGQDPAEGHEDAKRLMTPEESERAGGFTPALQPTYVQVTAPLSASVVAPDAEDDSPYGEAILLGHPQFGFGS